MSAVATAWIEALSLSTLAKELKRLSFFWSIFAFGDNPAFLPIESHSGKGIGHHVTLDRFGRMTCPPTDDVTAEPRLTKNIPKCFAFARCACIRPCAAVYRI